MTPFQRNLRTMVRLGFVLLCFTWFITFMFIWLSMSPSH